MEYSVKNVIRNRRSVRTYNGEGLRGEDRDKIETYLKTIENPFDIPVEFKILDAKEHGLSSPVVLGEKLYVGGKLPRVPYAEEAFGYAFEKFVLYAASLGVGTVWIAGTMKRGIFEKAMEIKEGEVMPAVSPIGYPAAEMSLRETIMRNKIKADERLPFETLFFNGSFSNPLTAADARRFEEPLEMVRLAPSATNTQPWRIVVCGDMVHFYEKKSKGYAMHSLGDIQKVDLGIAMAHFELTATENGIKGKFIAADPGIDKKADTDYIISYKPD